MGKERNRKDERNYKKNAKRKLALQARGITLVALVITIIIIIILATVTIRFAFTDDGIIQRAEQAADMYANDTAYTDQSMANVVGYLDEMIEQGISDEINSLSKRNILWIGDNHMAGTENNDKGFSSYFIENEKVNKSNVVAYPMIITDKRNEEITTFSAVIEDIEGDSTTNVEPDIIIIEIGNLDCYVYDMFQLDSTYKKEIGTADNTDTQDTVISDLEKGLNKLRDIYPDAEILYIKSYDTSENGWKNFGLKDILKYNEDITLEYLQEYFKEQLNGTIYETIEEYRDLLFEELGYTDEINNIINRSNLLYTEIPKLLNKLNLHYLDLSTSIKDNTTKYINSSDGISLTDQAYRDLTPQIIEQVKTILKNKPINDENILVGKNILWFGDSLIAGVGGGTIAGHVQNSSGAICYNAAVGGSQVYNGAENNIKSQIESAISYINQEGINIDYIIMNGGGNDAYLDTEIGTINQDGDTITTSFKEIVNLVKTNFPNTKIIYLNLVNLNVVTDYTEQQKERYIEILNQIQTIVGSENIEYLDLSYIITKEYLEDDGMHINEQGYMALAPYIIEYLKENM